MFLYLSNSPAATADSVNELTLPQAIDMALAYNRILLNKQTGLTRSALSIDSARSEFDLSIKPEITASYDNLGQSVSQLDIVSHKRFRAGAELNMRVGNRTFAGRDTGVISLELSQPLFRNRGVLVNTLPVFTAEQGHISAQREYQVARQQLVMEVIRIYLEIVRFHRQEQADRDSVERAKFSLRTTKAKELLGLTTSIDRLRVEIQLGQAQQKLQTTTKQRENAGLRLSDLLGQDHIWSLPSLSMEIPAPNINTYHPEELYRTALANRLDMASVLQNQVIARRNVRVAQRQKWPQIDLKARVEQADKDVFFESGSSLKDSHRFFIGLSANTGISKKRSNIEFQQAVNAEHLSRNAITNLEQRIRLEINEVLQEKRLIEQRIKIAQANYDHAKHRLELAERLFELGREPQLSVFDAETSFTQSEQSLIQTKSDLLLVQYQILFVSGTLLDSLAMPKPGKQQD